MRHGKVKYNRMCEVYTSEFLFNERKKRKNQHVMQYNPTYKIVVNYQIRGRNLLIRCRKLDTVVV